jgi:polar amino acid transport system substrate-binding protein
MTTRSVRRRTLLASFALALSVAAAACAAPSATSPSAGQSAAPAQKDALDGVKERGALRVSTDANYAPQSYFDEQTKEWTGFDIDVAREVAKRLGVQVEFITPDWSAITAGNWAGRWDVSIGSMTRTPERAKVLEFSPPYYYSVTQFGVRADLQDQIKSIADLAGRTVCVGEATTYEAYLTGKLDIEIVIPPPADVKVVPVKTDQDCIQSIQSGRKDYDAVLTAAPVINDGIKKGVPIAFLDKPPYYEELVIAIDKAGAPNAQLVAAISQAVNDMHADGTLSTLSKKYYDGLDLSVKQK